MQWVLLAVVYLQAASGLRRVDQEAAANAGTSGSKVHATVQGDPPKSLEECCTKVWPEKSNQPGFGLPLAGFGLRIMAMRGCADFDPEKCPKDEDDEEITDGTVEEVPYADALPEGTWDKAKLKLRKTADTLRELADQLVKDEEQLHSIGSAVFSDTMKHVATELSLFQDFPLNEDEQAVAVDKWKHIITPQQFKDMLASGVMGMNQVGEVIQQPDLFQVRVDALNKLFIMFHKPGSEFWADLTGGELRWPLAMFGLSKGVDKLLPGALDEITKTWGETCGKVPDCDATVSCYDPAAGACVARRAIAYDPDAGPLDPTTFSVIHRQWRCMNTPELMTERALQMCEVCSGFQDCKRFPAELSHEERLEFLTKWMSGRAITECKGKQCYDAQSPGWFTELGEAEKDLIVKQAIGMGELDPADVPGPLNPEEKEEAAAMMKKLTVGIDTVTGFKKWLQEGAFDGRFKDKEKAREVLHQVANIRSRSWKAYPQCPPSTTDCLGKKAQMFAARNAEEASGNLLEQASVRWRGAAEAEAESRILQPPEPATESQERSDYKQAVDLLVKDIGRTTGVASKVQKLIYQGKIKINKN